MDLSKDIEVDSNGCHVWLRSCNSAGYAQKTIQGQYWTLHRYIYSLKDPSLTRNDIVRHLCHNTKCINPDHLEKGSQKDNWKDSKDKYLDRAKTRRKTWNIEGSTYPTLRKASQETGIHMGTLIKYTVNGVFDTQAYRAGCKKANVTPKI